MFSRGRAVEARPLKENRPNLDQAEYIGAPITSRWGGTIPLFLPPPPGASTSLLDLPPLLLPFGLGVETFFPRTALASQSIPSFSPSPSFAEQLCTAHLHVLPSGLSGLLLVVITNMPRERKIRRRTVYLLTRSTECSHRLTEEGMKGNRRKGVDTTHRVRRRK